MMILQSNEKIFQLQAFSQKQKFLLHRKITNTKLGEPKFNFR